MLGLLIACALAAPSPPAVQAPLARRKVTTDDGVAIALYRYAPPGGGVRRRPVLLVADVGWGREVFDLQGQGLAPFLQDRGRDTFVVELRGQGRADAGASWHLADWVARDLPAAVAAIGQVHPGRIDVVAHGFAGALALAATTREIAGRVERVVALSTPVRAEVPNATVAQALRERSGSDALWADARTFDLILGQGGLWPIGRLAALRASAGRISSQAAGELLDWMQSGDLPLPGDEGLVARMRRYDRPTLVVLPLLDNFAHAEFAAPLRELAPLAAVQVRLLSRFEGCAEDYSHLSMLQGAQAATDVWTPALQFLDGP